MVRGNHDIADLNSLLYITEHGAVWGTRVGRGNRTLESVCGFHCINKINSIFF